MNDNNNKSIERAMEKKIEKNFRFIKGRLLILLFPFFLYIFLYIIIPNIFSYFFLIPRQNFGLFNIYGFLFVIVNVLFLCSSILFFYRKYHNEDPKKAINFYFIRPFVVIYRFVIWSIFHLFFISLFLILYLIFQDINFIALSILLSLYISADIINQFVLNNTFYLKNKGKILYFAFSLNQNDFKRSNRYIEILDRYFEEKKLDILNKNELENNLIHYLINIDKNNNPPKFLIETNKISFNDIFSAFENNLKTEIKIEVYTISRWLKKKIKLLGKAKNLIGIIPTIITIITYIITSF